MYQLTLKQQSIIEKLTEFTPVQITKDGYKISGFYKSGEVKLKPEGDYFVAHLRYDKKEDIYDFDDLVWLNYHWWQGYKDRADGWNQPEVGWDLEMERLGLVRKETKTYWVGIR